MFKRRQDKYLPGVWFIKVRNRVANAVRDMPAVWASDSSDQGCAGVVLAGTDLGGARQRIAALLDGLISQIAGGFVAGLQPGAAGTAASQPVRRELIRQVAARQWANKDQSVFD